MLETELCFMLKTDFKFNGLIDPANLAGYDYTLYLKNGL